MKKCSPYGRGLRVPSDENEIGLSRETVAIIQSNPFPKEFSANSENSIRQFFGLEPLTVQGNDRQ